MTESKFWQYLRSVLRRAWLRHPVRREVIKDAYVMDGVNEETGRKVKLYRCSVCLGLYPLSKLEVDHIVPVGSLRSYYELNVFTERLFCPSDGLRVVCVGCHKHITREQRKSKCNQAAGNKTGDGQIPECKCVR